jgi:7 transmembrane receptor (rhodopsin family)
MLQHMKQSKTLDGSVIIFRWATLNNVDITSPPVIGASVPDGVGFAVVIGKTMSSPSVTSSLDNDAAGIGDSETVAPPGTESKPWPVLKQPFYAVIVLAFAYAIVVALGLVNNILVVTVVWTQPALRTVTNFFLANLAVADILVCIIVLPITLLDNIFTGNVRYFRIGIDININMVWL